MESHRSRMLLGASLFTLSCLMSPSWSQAAPFAASETILDIGLDLNERDLFRGRLDSTGLSTTGIDATIISQNNVGAGFGLNGTGPDAYHHNMTWISPATASILTPSLYIDAFGVGGSGILGLTPNDAVYTDGNFIGNLNVGTILTLGVSLTSFTINPLWLTDGLLNIQINHSSGDQFSVFGSKLAIDYHGAGGAGSAVPEPSSLLLMASGLAGLSLWGRRKMALATTK